MVFLYNLALALAALAGIPYWLWLLARGRRYREGLSERLGSVPQRLELRPEHAPRIWIQAVSVGEVLAVAELVARLRAAYPGGRVFISTTTAAGQELARERFGEESVFYLPFDFGFAIQPYLRWMQPQLVMLAETEFWPNLLRLAKKSGARVAVVNARISDRSLPGYRRWRGFLRAALANADLFLAQSEEDRRRLVEIGAETERVQVSGNLKFDGKAPAATPLVAELRAAMAGSGVKEVVVCGSTMAGEEEALLKALDVSSSPQRLVILAPRRPERFDEVEKLIARFQVKSWRRSTWNKREPLSSGVMLLDTVGELAAVYALATIAFVGGSLAATGGHNILEPAQFGVPIVVGPHTGNFRDMVAIFRRANALVEADAANPAAAFQRLLSNAAEREALGRRAQEVFRSQAGATARTLEALRGLLGQEAAR